MDKKIEDIRKEIDKIDWLQYENEYIKTAEKLKNLFDKDKKVVLDATHKLWCSLCHQYAYVIHSALPAYDFLMYGLLNLDDYVKVEILDILRGFASCTNHHVYVATSWKYQLREKLRGDYTIFQKLSTHSDEDISGLANDICEALDNSLQNDENLEKLAIILENWVVDNHLQSKSILEFAWRDGEFKDILSNLGCIYQNAMVSYDMMSPRHKKNMKFDAILDAEGGTFLSGKSKDDYFSHIYDCLKIGAPILFIRQIYSKKNDLKSNEYIEKCEQENTKEAFEVVLSSTGFVVDKFTVHELEGEQYSHFMAIYAHKPNDQNIDKAKEASKVMLKQ